MARKITHRIDDYTGRYDDAICPPAEVRYGELVWIANTPDGREIDAFHRRRKDAGLELDFVRAGRGGGSTFRLVPFGNY